MTLTLDRVILHTVMHHLSTSTYMPNFLEIEEIFVDGRTYGHLRPALLGRLRRIDLTSICNVCVHKSISDTDNNYKTFNSANVYDGEYNLLCAH